MINGIEINFLMKFTSICFSHGVVKKRHVNSFDFVIQKKNNHICSHLLGPKQQIRNRSKSEKIIVNSITNVIIMNIFIFREQMRSHDKSVLFAKGVCFFNFTFFCTIVLHTFCIYDSILFFLFISINPSKHISYDMCLFQLHVLHWVLRSVMSFIEAIGEKNSQRSFVYPLFLFIQFFSS